MKRLSLLALFFITAIRAPCFDRLGSVVSGICSKQGTSSPAVSIKLQQPQAVSAELRSQRVQPSARQIDPNRLPIIFDLENPEQRVKYVEKLFKGHIHFSGRGWEHGPLSNPVFVRGDARVCLWTRYDDGTTVRDTMDIVQILLSDGLDKDVIHMAVLNGDQEPELFTKNPNLSDKERRLLVDFARAYL